MNEATDVTFEAWLLQLKQLAAERELLWLVSDDSHRDAYTKGLSPEDELSALADMAQWRGCGCGGG